VNIGGLAATVIPWATNKRWPGEDDLRSFRVPLYVALAAPVLTLIAEVFLLVESPYWLMMKGRKEQARKALAFINPKSSEVDLDRAVAVLEYTLEKEAEANEQVVAECFPTSKGSSAHHLFLSDRQHRNTTYVDCFKGVDLRRTFCAVFPPISQNLTGQNLVGTYATCESHPPSLPRQVECWKPDPFHADFFVIAKQSDPLISSVITTSVGLASNFISFFLIENKKIGRWMLLFVGIIVMTLCMLGLGITDVVAKSDFSQAQGSVLVALVSIFLAASTIGPGVAFAIRHSVGVPRSSNYHYYRLMAAIRRFQSAHACRGQSFGLSKMESWCQGRNRKPGYEGRIRKTSRLQHFVIIWLMSSD
jgi:SP family general alpha glucoside:H+ symporter-like MFS transporter